MARLSAHGAEIGRLEFTDYRKAYMADGAILKDTGFGWKLHGKCKPGFSPAQVFERAKAKQAETLANRPMLAAYRSALHDAAPLSKRWKLSMAIKMMPQDPDGVWSDCCDSGFDSIDCDLDDIVSLCRLYESAMSEAKELSGANVSADIA